MFDLVGLPLTSADQVKNSNFTLPILALTNNLSTIPITAIQSNFIDNKVNQSSTESYNTTITLPIVSTGNEIVSFIITDPKLYQIKDIEIYGKKYSNSFENNLTVGTFKLDPITKEVQIYLQPQNNYTTNTAIKINGSTKKLVTNEVIDVPNFIKEYNLVGNISISKSFQDHPSCSFSLLTDSANINAIELLFNAHKYTHLFDKKFIFFDTPYRIKNFSLNISKITESPNGEFKVQINFEGWYSHLVNKSIKVRPGNTDTNKECNINTNNKPKISTTGSATNPNKIRISLGQLASNAPLEYNGTIYYFEIDKNTPNDAITTFSSELNRILPSKSEFPIYSLASGITTKKWNTVSSFQINGTDILSDCPINYNAEHIKYAPGVLTWKDNSADNSSDNSSENFKNERPKFEYRPPKRSTVTTGDANVGQPPANVSVIQTLDMNYDQSGEKKVQVITVYEGSTVIQETTKTYGLAYSAVSIYNNNSGRLFGGAPTFWKLVEEITISHLYDSNTGYYLGNNVTGKKLVRFIQESSELETVAYKNSTDKVEKAQLQAMKFRYIPITGHTRYVLRQHKDYYKDQQFKHPYIVYPWCTNSGNFTYLQMKDPTYADDMFVGIEETYKHCFASIPNPENLGEPEIKLPVLTTGSIFYNSVRTQVSASKSVYDAGTDAIGSDFDNPEERYVTYTKQYSAQDSNFTNSLEDINTQMNSGRPSTANRRPSDYVAASDESKDPLQLNNLSGGSITTKLSETKTNEKKKNDTQYIAYSPPYNNSSIVTGSFSFEYAESIAEAIEALKTQLSIQKTQQEVTVNLTTLFNIYLLEGSKYSFEYLNKRYDCRILSISHSLEIQGVNSFGELVVTGTSSIQLGIEQYANITYYTKLKDDKSNTPRDNTVTISNPLYIGRTLGSLINIADSYPISRGNFRQ